MKGVKYSYSLTQHEDEKQINTTAWTTAKHKKL